jgi:hypothetical protein
MRGKVGPGIESQARCFIWQRPCSTLHLPSSGTWAAKERPTSRPRPEFSLCSSESPLGSMAFDATDGSRSALFRNGKAPRHRHEMQATPLVAHRSLVDRSSVAATVSDSDAKVAGHCSQFAPIAMKRSVFRDPVRRRCKIGVTAPHTRSTIHHQSSF